MDIKITRTTNPKPLPDESKHLGFGSNFTDHMFVMDHDDDGWHNARIVPYGPLTLDPAASVFHYGGEIFEGLKAYRGADGKVRLFRPDENGARMKNSAIRMGMPHVEPEDFVEAVKALVEVDERWVPHKKGNTLYIRPFLIATDPNLTLHGIHQEMFLIILSPSGSYFADGLTAVKGAFETVHGPWRPGVNMLVVNAFELAPFKSALSGFVPVNRTEGAKPVINTVFDETTRVYDEITGTDLFSIAGNDLAPDANAEDEYVALVNAQGVETKCEIEFSDVQNVKARLAAALPAGQYTLKVYTRSGFGGEFGVHVATRKVMVA